MDDFRDRIVELRRVPASELLPNPKNWREHSAEQLKAIEAVFAQIGIAGAEMVFETPEGLMLFDGHARQEVAGDQLVPVLVTDLTHEEADVLLATFDPLGMMAQTNADQLRELMESIQVNTDGVEQLLSDISGMFDLENLVSMGEPETEDEPAPKIEAGVLAARFGVVPFSIINTREGWWQERKRAWLSLGIASEVGRGENLLKFSDTVQAFGRKPEPAASQGSVSAGPQQPARPAHQDPGSSGDKDPD